MLPTSLIAWPGQRWSLPWLTYCFSFPKGWRGSSNQLSKLHHGSADNFSRSQQVEIFVELLELEDFEGVADLVLSRQRHDLGQVGIVAPERTVKGLFARNPREERNIDAVADKPHVGIVPADPQQAESHLHHLWSTGAVNDGVEITLACGLTKFRGNLLGGLVPDANDVIGPVVLGHREFVGVAGEGDDPRATSEDLGILNRIRAKSTDPKNSDHSVRA